MLSLIWSDRVGATIDELEDELRRAKNVYENTQKDIKEMQMLNKVFSSVLYWFLFYDPNLSESKSLCSVKA